MTSIAEFRNNHKQSVPVLTDNLAGELAQVFAGLKDGTQITDIHTALQIHYKRVPAGLETVRVWAQTLPSEIRDILVPAIGTARSIKEPNPKGPYPFSSHPATLGDLRKMARENPPNFDDPQTGVRELFLYLATISG